MANNIIICSNHNKSSHPISTKPTRIQYATPIIIKIWYKYHQQPIFHQLENTKNINQQNGIISDSDVEDIDIDFNN